MNNMHSSIHDFNATLKLGKNRFMILGCIRLAVRRYIEYGEHMKNQITEMYLKQSMVALLLVFTALPVFADELTDRQYSVTQAQKQYELEKARYDDVTQLVNEQKQRVAQDQALLKERQKKQATAKAKMLEAKKKLDQENSRLKQVWNKGSR